MCLEVEDYAESAVELGYSTVVAPTMPCPPLCGPSGPKGSLLRQLETMRLDALQESLWDAATSGDARAVDQVVRIIMARVRLLGLDQFEDKARGGCRPVVSTAWRG
jgi:hypothetical protein